MGEFVGPSKVWMGHAINRASLSDCSLATPPRGVGALGFGRRAVAPDRNGLRTSCSVTGSAHRTSVTQWEYRATVTHRDTILAFLASAMSADKKVVA